MKATTSPHTSLRRALCILGLLAALALAPGRARATWYTMVMGPGPDIISVDVRWPYFPPGTYFALWNGNTAPAAGYFYGGVAITGPGRDAPMAEQMKAGRSLVWSFWGNDAVYKGNRVRIDTLGDATFGGVMSGEGTQAGLSANLSFIRPGQWYRMVLRTWQDPTKPAEKGYLGWWMGDLQRNEWRLMGVVSIPALVTGVDCGASFCEVIGPPGERVIERRLGYHRVKGVWRPAPTLRSQDLYRFTVIEEGSAFRFSSLRTPEDARREGRADLSELTLTRQPALPLLARPAAAQVRAVGFGGQVGVTWAIPPAASPQLSYEVELFDGPAARGARLAASRGIGPSVRAHRLDAPVPARSARLTIRDIYDQKTVIVVPVAPMRASPAVRLASPPAHGVQYAYEEAPAGRRWIALPTPGPQPPRFRGVLNHLDDSVSMGRSAPYAFHYRGYLSAPADGVYVLELRSCDGSRLAIDGRPVLSHDGLHSASSRFAVVLLRRGLHPFELRYFRSADGAGNWLESKLALAWSGPGLAPRPVAAADLFRPADPGLPTIRLQRRQAGAAEPAIVPTIAARGHRPARVDLFCGKTRLAVLPAAGAGSAYAAMLPAGAKALWARLWYDGDRTVDSPLLECATTDVVTAPWERSVMGEQGLPLGVSARPDRVAMIGDCECFIHQPVAGDFDLRARIAAISRSTPENGIAGDALIGLLCRGEGARQGAEDFGLWDTAGIGLRGTACDRDLETSRQHRYSLGSGATHPWVRLVRRGLHLRAFSSADGVAWTPVIDRLYRTLPDRMRVGVYLRTMNPGTSRTLFTGAVEQIALTSPGPDVPSLAARTPGAADCFAGRVVAVAHAGPRILARTIGRGLLASADAGATWRPLNAGLPAPAALAIRSVGVHPDSPAVLLRAAGAGGGLWRSADGGETWRAVCREIDFDGAGPSALCGEVISFDPRNPAVVAAGGESAGLYISRDAGETWTYAGLRGERITVVAFSPYQKDLLIIGTSAASAFAGPAPGSSPAAGRVFTADGAGANITAVTGRPGLGITNVAFERIAEGERYLYFATTHGLYYCYNLETLFQYRDTVAPDAPYTAVASSPGENRSDIYAAPFSSDRSPLFAGRIGYYWSVDWRALPPAPRGVTAILADPSRQALWLCCRSGIYRSPDAGATWRPVLSTPEPPD